MILEATVTNWKNKFMPRNLRVIILILLSVQISGALRAETIELLCKPDGQINSDITLTVNYEKKEIVYMSEKLLRRNAKFKGYHYKIRQLSDEHLTAYEPRDSKSVGTSTLVINKLSGHFALATIGNYRIDKPNPLTIITAQGLCKTL